jgi:hypothetical protein
MSKSFKQLHFAPAKTRHISLQTGLQFHSRRHEQPPHRKAGWITNSEWLAGNRSSSSDNNLRLGRLDSCSNGFRANAAAERPSPTRRQEPAIKAKETEPRRRTSSAPKRTDRSSLPSSPQERERGRPRTRTPPSWRTMCWATPQQPAAQQGPAVGGSSGGSARAARAGEPDVRQLPAP